MKMIIAPQNRGEAAQLHHNSAPVIFARGFCLLFSRRPELWCSCATCATYVPFCGAALVILGVGVSPHLFGGGRRILIMSDAEVA